MRVIVTGAGSGIGAAVVRLAIQRGAKVAAIDLSAGDSIPDEVTFQRCDVSIDSEVDEAVDRTFAINVRGSMLLARAVGRAALAAGTGASLVLLSSVAAERGEESEPAAAYAAGKGAVVSLTKQLAVEWGQHGIRVNAVMPGVIDTPMTTVIQDTEATAQFLNSLPLRRVGTADEVARACMFLANDDSSFITGTVLPVDGGFLAA